MTDPYNQPFDPNNPYGAQPPGGMPPYGAGGGYGGGPQGPMPDNNLVWAILSTLLCCLPLGVVSIVKSTQVSKLWSQGDQAGAERASADAKKWAIWSAVAGVVFMVLYVILVVVAGVGLNSNV